MTLTSVSTVSDRIAGHENPILVVVNCKQKMAMHLLFVTSVGKIIMTQTVVGIESSYNAITVDCLVISQDVVSRKYRISAMKPAILK